jgi:hypothetical protein
MDRHFTRESSWHLLARLRDLMTLDVSSTQGIGITACASSE